MSQCTEEEQKHLGRVEMAIKGINMQRISLRKSDWRFKEKVKANNQNRHI